MWPVQFHTKVHRGRDHHRRGHLLEHDGHDHGRHDRGRHEQHDELPRQARTTG